VIAQAHSIETPSCEEFDSRFIKKTYKSNARAQRDRQRRDREQASQEF